MTMRLEELDLLKIDRVRKGAGPGARIVLMKQHQVEKMTLEDIHNQAAKAVADANVEMSWFETLDVDSLVGIFKDFEGARWGIQLEKDGDGFKATGTAFEVVAEFRPINKSGATASGEGEATVPIKKEDLDDDVLAFVEGVEKELVDAVAKADADATEIAELKEAAEAATGDGEGDTEDVLKGLSDEARAVIEKAQAEAAEAKEAVAKMELERETARFVNIAKSDLGKSGEDAIETASALQAVAGTHGEDSAVYKTVYKTVKGASALVDAAMQTLGTGVGSTQNLGGAGEDAGTQMQALTKEYIAEHKVGFEEAWGAVRKAHPELVQGNEDARTARRQAAGKG